MIREGFVSAKIVVETPGGGKLYVGGGAQAAGLSEVSFAEEATKAAGTKFQAALGSLGWIVETLEKSLGEITKRPEKVEVEFSASVTTECNLHIVSGEVDAEFKVTLTWGKEG
jgi:hypothetical protein